MNSYPRDSLIDNTVIINHVCEALDVKPESFVKASKRPHIAFLAYGLVVSFLIDDQGFSINQVASYFAHDVAHCAAALVAFRSEIDNSGHHAEKLVRARRILQSESYKCLKDVIAEQKRYTNYNPSPLKKVAL